MKKHKEYIERSDLKNSTHLELEVYYSKGGLNFISGGTTPRGYYASVRPVTKTNISVSFDMFSGCAELLSTTSRYTDKQFDAAVEKSKSVIPALIEKVLAKSKAA
jgi:hypothetical protein